MIKSKGSDKFPPLSKPKSTFVQWKTVTDFAKARWIQ